MAHEVQSGYLPERASVRLVSRGWIARWHGRLGRRSKKPGVVCR